MKKMIRLIVLAVFLLAACSAPAEDPPPTLPSPTEAMESLPSSTATPTEAPPVVLRICTADLPETLFPYAGVRSEAKERILALLYPPPFESVEGTLTLEILEKIPTQEAGDLRLDPVPIRRGQTVVDVRGELVTAGAGVRVRPSGCRGADCSITWDGVAPLEMDQMVLDFKLRDDLSWSDGTPVTAADAVFSFRLASAPEAPSYGWAEARTQGYSALDAHTVEWRGYPGFASPDLARFFWGPLPTHLFTGSAGWDQVVAAEVWGTSPLSFGPFILAEWGAEEVHLAKNPAYFRVDEALSVFDEIVFFLVSDGAGAGWEALQSGACDVLDASFRLGGDPELLAAIEAEGGFEMRVVSADSWVQLVIGIQPAEYDALDNPIFAARPDFFGDVHTRQGIAMCLDRQAMLVAMAGAWGAPWPSFLPPEESRLDAGLGILFDPAAGGAALEAAGWRDHDGDPSTPRVAQGVANVFDGTPLSVELLVGPSAFHQDVASVIQASLGECGLAVDVQTLPLADLYAPGPAGLLFGRNFDLALIAWQPLPAPDCGLYQSWQVPNAENSWIGTNIAGLAEEGYDGACAAASLALPGEYDRWVALAEEAFVNLLPAVPLVAPPVIEVWRGDS